MLNVLSNHYEIEEHEKQKTRVESKGQRDCKRKHGNVSMLEAPVAQEALMPTSPSLIPSPLPFLSVLLFLQLILSLHTGQEYNSRKMVEQKVKCTGELVPLPFLPGYPCCCRVCTSSTWRLASSCHWCSHH
jgi:hypothetical protein